METAETTYDRDFVEWTREQAKALRAAQAAGVNLALDWNNLAEEIEDMGKSQRRELASRARVVVEHLLKLQCSRATQPRADWETTVAREREQIRELLADSPSLRRELASLAQEAMVSARKIADRSLKAHEDKAAPYPESYSVAQVFDDWYPDEPG